MIFYQILSEQKEKVNYYHYIMYARFIYFTLDAQVSTVNIEIRQRKDLFSLYSDLVYK